MEKKYDYIEVQCVLHTECNLRCKFCFETEEKGIRKPTTINIDYINNLHNQIMESIIPVINSYDINTLEMSLMGGELFSDNISDEVFSTYRSFITNLRDTMGALYPNIKCQFKVLTNGIFSNYDRIEKILTDFDMRLVLSYDACDRFRTEDQRQMWYNTYQYFRKLNIELWVATVLTKKNIDAYIAGDEVFNSIPQDSYVENNIYIPRLDYHDNLPTDEDIFNYYKWCLDSGKFNINLINILLKTYDNDMRVPSCGETRYDFMFAEEFKEKYNMPYITKCTEESPVSKEDYYGEYADVIKDVNNCAKYKHHLARNKRGCLYCEYHGKCAEPCWTQVLFNDYKVTECPIKRAYNYVKENPDILNKYREWDKKYGE